MDFLPPKLEDFVTKNTSPENTNLYQLNRETHLKILQPRMLSGHVQGRILSMLSNMISPKNVLEIGTYTGYSAICFAEGMDTNGKLITIDINNELETFAKKHFKQAGFENIIDMKIGNALDIIPTLNETFDLIFIDADKNNYSNYYDLAFDKLNKGGYFIADNVLWSGKVVTEEAKTDLDTKSLVDFCKKVHDDDRVENVLFPVRDGLMIIRKI
jgi:predicted O-methyltransferase YrrM